MIDSSLHTKMISHWRKHDGRILVHCIACFTKNTISLILSRQRLMTWQWHINRKSDDEAKANVLCNGNEAIIKSKTSVTPKYCEKHPSNVKIFAHQNENFMTPKTTCYVHMRFLLLNYQLSRKRNFFSRWLIFFVATSPLGLSSKKKCI